LLAHNALKANYPAHLKPQKKAKRPSILVNIAKAVLQFQGEIAGIKKAGIARFFYAW